VPRKPRYEEAGAIHHVWARGVNKRTIFVTEFDRRIYLVGLGEVVVERGWDCLAYCLMTNHIHLLIRTREPDLGKGMQRHHSLYAQEFNQRYGRIGHLFQDRFGSSRIRSEAQLFHAAEYIAQNPVRAGLCLSADDWRWSSRGAIARGLTPPWLAATQEFGFAGRASDQPESARALS
jgi:putative transposase